MRTFLIPSLLAAGFSGHDGPSNPILSNLDGVGDATPEMAQRLQLQHTFTLAGHRSHSSHSSHSSHRSSSSGGYAAPRPSAPAYTPPSSGTRNQSSTPPSSILPSPPAAAAPKTLPGNSGKFLEIVRKVQLALTSYGYYDGAIDGVIGKNSRAALSRFQSDYGLKVTGTITPEVLDAFGIAAR